MKQAKPTANSYNVVEFLNELESHSAASDFNSLLATSNDVSKSKMKPSDMLNDENSSSYTNKLFRLNKVKLNDAVRCESFQTMLLADSSKQTSIYFNENVRGLFDEKSAQAREEYQSRYKLNFAEDDEKQKKLTEKTNQIETIINKAIEAEKTVKSTSKDKGNVDDWLDDLLSDE